MSNETYSKFCVLWYFKPFNLTEFVSDWNCICILLSVLLSTVVKVLEVHNFTTQWRCGSSFHTALPALKCMFDMSACSI